jgi:FAD/FMN-containing dehydrogenase
MIDKRPAVIAQCTSPADVIDALALAGREGYEVAVRAGGHSVAGVSVNDGGIVIDVRSMNQVEVDPDAREARVGAGATWSEFDLATQEHGLATTGGRVSTTGVAGLTLGGGSGWLERRYGLACDNLISLDLITADGRAVTASEHTNPDLFWALHGGGGNFGVVTSFVFRLHPVGPIVTAGLMMWPGDAATEVARRYRDVAGMAPDELGSGLVFLTGPPEEFVPAHLQGTTVVGVAALWAGDVDEGAEAVKPFRDLSPEVDLVGPMPYAEFQCMLDDPPGLHNYWSADYHDEFPDEALDIFVKYGFERQSPFAQQILVPWGGAVARVAEDATPMTKRSVSWITHPFAMWEDPAATRTSSGRGRSSATSPVTPAAAST